MSGLGKKLLTSAFRVALWGTIGAGITAGIDSPQKEQHDLPSLSQQDARKNYHESIEVMGAAFAAMEIESILGEMKGRRKEREALALTPT